MPDLRDVLYNESNPIIVNPPSRGSVDQDVRTGGRSFDRLPGQYSLRGLMIVLRQDSFLSVTTKVTWESIQWLAKNIVQRTGKKNSGKAWIDALAAAI